MSRGRRIFLGPIEIAGYYGALDAGLRELGLDSCSIDLEPHPFSYRAEARDDPGVIRLVTLVRDRRPKPGGSGAIRALWRSVWLASRLLLLVWALVRFDVFVLSAGVTLLRGYDLPILRLLGKRLIFVFHGSESRPAYIDGQRMAPGRALGIPECIAAARRQKDGILRIERYADVIVAQPAFSHFFERPVVNWFAVGVPWRDPPKAKSSKRDHNSIRILHSPSDPTLKGSERIREAVEQLRAEGLPLDLVELRGVPNEVVLNELADCDFVIDQLYSDAPMVGFATEAAVASRPAIVGGYAWAANRSAFGPIPFPPVEECAPEDLVDAIRRLATDAEHREALGRKASAFVHDYWSRDKIARRMQALMEGPPPDEWLFDPQRIRYVEGCGLSRERARDVVAAVLLEGGREALCLSDKPQLEAAFVAFAGVENGHSSLS
jgi:glycosyltransferase involved in cell wall biosynthesis